MPAVSLLNTPEFQVRLVETALAPFVMFRSYNLAVSTSHFFRQCSLWLAILLMGLLALGPFLHAHYGHSQATGFHINGLETAATATHPSVAAYDAPAVSVPIEPESPAVGVVTSLPRFEKSDLFSADILEILLLSFFILNVFNRLPRIWQWVPTVNPFVACSFKAGFPPPALAPPFSH